VSWAMVVKRFRIGNWRISIGIVRVVDVVGVNSKLPDGNHILMWDFDETDLDTVIKSLLITQRVYELPNIYILETKKDTNYIAYCFKRVDWRKAQEIVIFTKGVDPLFWRYGVLRGHFTLRVTPKCGRMPKLVWVIPGVAPEDASIPELKSWTKYETLADVR